MPRDSNALTSARKEEIVNACEKLYQTMGFKEITIKEIGNVTSFTRTSVYNYFHTKEEIFLALLEREYERWISDLNLIAANEGLSTDDFAQALAHSVEKREQLLKLMCMNHFEMEENSRMECLVEFKATYGRCIKMLQKCLARCFPEMTDAEKQDFIYHFLPFVYGIYPYTAVTEKQREAMEQAGVDFVYHTVFELVYGFTVKLLVKDKS